MRKATRNYLIVLAQTLSALLLIVSALLLWLVFPRGFLAARDLWIDIHKWNGVALVALTFLHLVLHWSWLVQMTKRYLVPPRIIMRQAVERVLDLLQARKAKINREKRERVL
jgi:hypothetical protein